MSGGLDALLASLSSEPAKRGRDFERLTKWFLENDPVYKALLRKVWLWKDWPGRWGPDAGIDLVAEAVDGGTWAIQAKAYSEHVAITKSDVDTFLSESSRPIFDCRLLVATTDRLGPTASRTLESQAVQVRKMLLSGLRDSGVVWPASMEKLRPGPQKPLKLRPHQRAACRDVIAGLANCDRGQLVMACGTGKTLTSLRIAEGLGANRVLVLVPSLSLLSQVAHAWAANSTRPLQFIAVCSDETVVDEDQLVASTADLAFPATTSAVQVESFLRSRRNGAKVVFATYQSSAVVAQAQAAKGSPTFDLVVADEAHRLVGGLSGDFGKVLRADAIRSKKRLFMTATPRYATGRVIKEAGQQDIEVASMDDSKLFGPRLHTLAFGEAIRLGLLTDYQVAVVGIDDATYLDWAQRGVFLRSEGLRDMDARSLASHIGLAKAFKKFNIRKAISFHGRVKAARHFAAVHPEVLGWMPKSQRPTGTLSAGHISGQMPAGDRRVRLDVLRSPSTTRALLTNARCLTEGIDVPSLDGVAFIDPRRSEVDIVQAVGRAIRLAPDKRLGTIVIPVFVGRAAAADDAVRESTFKPVCDVLNALRAHDAELGGALDSLRRSLGAKRLREVRLPGKIYLDLPSWVTTEFSRAIRIRLVERTTPSWEFMFGLLERVAAAMGTARIKATHREGDIRIGAWVSVQRQQRHALSKERQLRLEALPDWTWDPISDVWERAFAFLADYGARTGGSNPQRGHKVNGFDLGSWAIDQRTGRRSLTDEQRERLESLPGWSWDPRSDKWEHGFNMLMQFVEREKSARVKATHREDGFRLGGWVQKQRQDRAVLSEDRRKRLEAVQGWSWDHFDDAWEKAFEKVLAYTERTGSTSIPRAYAEGNFRLGLWLDNQRRRADRLPAQRLERLQALPCWAPPKEDPWEAGFAVLVRRVKKTKSSRTKPGERFEGFALGQWVASQRQRRHRLSKERRLRLEALPEWTWNPLDDDWNSAFARLTEYARTHGHARPAPRYVEPDGFRLGQWVGYQRAQRLKMPAARRKRLESLRGWTWTAKQDMWDRGYLLLKAYVKRRGDARVPTSHREEGFALGKWVGNQRSKRKSMSKQRRAQLEALPGWTWNARQPARKSR